MVDNVALTTVTRSHEPLFSLTSKVKTTESDGSSSL